MGKSWCRGGLSRHEVHAAIEDVAIDLTFDAEVPPWRPASGHFFLGEDEARYFAWLLVMARARVTASITLGGRRQQLSGLGYHDHNWGNSAPASIVDHWYWGHVHLGPYTFVAVRAVSHAKYGRRVFPVFLLAQGGEILAQSTTDGLGFLAHDESVEPSTGVPVASRLTYELEARGERFRVDFARRRDVLALGFGDAGGYLRFVGDARLERQGGPAFEGQGLWEILSFGPRQVVNAAGRE
jgi:hypothetical protein